jgi:outer membrane protein assembly factor BamE (lipoprotein component of BamABCDE complex)
MWCGALILCGTMLPGCLVSSTSRESYTGTYVSDQTFGQIQAGVTTRQWVMGTLGEPTCKTTLENGEELWKWTYSKVKRSSGAVLFIFGGSSSSETGGAAYVQMKDGVVTKAWRAS